MTSFGVVGGAKIAVTGLGMPGNWFVPVWDGSGEQLMGKAGPEEVVSGVGFNRKRDLGQQETSRMTTG